MDWGIVRMTEEQSIPIEKVLQSKGRVKILKIIAEEGELNISEIGRRARLNNRAMHSHLKFLIQADILQEKKFGRVRIYRFRIELVKVRAIKNLFNIWENSEM